MKLDIGGEEVIGAAPEALWRALNDPLVLTRCIPGCKAMTLTAPDAYTIVLELKVASVGGSFEGAIALAEKHEPLGCVVAVSGAGTLGNGKGAARFEIQPQDAISARLVYRGEGEIGGLVAGVGQRILKGVSKHLIGQFFKALRKEFGAASQDAA